MTGCNEFISNESLVIRSHAGLIDEPISGRVTAGALKFSTSEFVVICRSTLRWILQIMNEFANYEFWSLGAIAE